jgi:crotonobetainyl-CoA:carnitine CoA-transferase CaiB-like acyl-CoA transferase
MAALEGIRVLDFGRYVAGPYCATLLADFGADVIRIERLGGNEDRAVSPVTEDGEGSLHLQLNRNKRSMALDTKKAEARRIVELLIAQSDIVVANVPTSALRAMGIDYETLAAIKPSIILANVSAFGPVGPWSERSGFDSVGQAMSGAAYLTGMGDPPIRTSTTWVDHATALYTALGVMLALTERGRTGRGQQIDCSLLGSAMAFNAPTLIEQAIAAPNRTAIGNRSFGTGPTDIFRTTDGWIVTQVVSNALFARWTALVNEPAWQADPRFQNDDLRGRNGEVLSARMAEWCKDKTTKEALDALAAARIPAGPVLSPQAVLDHPQVAGMNFLVPTKVAGLDQPALLMRAPIDLSRTPGTIRRPPPRAGEHNAEILAELGYAAETIASLREAGVISP